MEQTVLATVKMAGIPLWIKIVYTAFVVGVIPVYIKNYPLSNFLWFSDIGLLLAVPALWLESPLLTGMIAVSLTLPELAWNIGFFLRLIFHVDAAGLAGYMFYPEMPLYVRCLSLFHVFLPPLVIWMVYRLGYDRRAWLYQCIVMVVVLFVVHARTDPAQNVDWAFGPSGKPQHWMAQGWYIVGLMVFLAFVIYLPTHLILLKLFGHGPRVAAFSD